MLGMFITFEGIEGSGKSTQLKLAHQALTKSHAEVVATREPGGTALGESIRDLLLGNPKLAIKPEAELLLFSAARTQHLAEVILPSLAAGKVVMSDRFHDATTAYQCGGRKLNAAWVERLNREIVGRARPNLTLLFDLPVEVAMQRLSKRQPHSGRDRFERMEVEFHERVRQAYLEIAKQEPERVKIIDANLPQDLVNRLVMKQIEPSLSGKS